MDCLLLSSLWEEIMKTSLEIIKKNKFPIQVTSACSKGELASWEKAFAEQGIKTTLKPERIEQRTDRKKPCEYFSLWRQVLPREIEEIKRNEWLLRNNSFIKPERYKNL